MAVAAFAGGPSGVVAPPGAGAVVFEADTGQPIVSLRGHAARVQQVRFVPGRPPRVVTGSADGTAIVWDVAAALRATAPVAPDRTDDRLWTDLSADDATTAYRAAVALHDRGHLARLLTSPPATKPSARTTYQALIAQLSAPDRPTRESAHRQLEAAGPAAAAAVRRALDAHPGGEAEVRLADLARLDEADGPMPADPGTSDDPAHLATARRRAAIVADWFGDAATTRP